MDNADSLPLVFTVTPEPGEGDIGIRLRTRNVLQAERVGQQFDCRVWFAGAQEQD